MNAGLFHASICHPRPCLEINKFGPVGSALDDKTLSELTNVRRFDTEPEVWRYSETRKFGKCPKRTHLSTHKGQPVSSFLLSSYLHIAG